MRICSWRCHVIWSLQLFTLSLFFSVLSSRLPSRSTTASWTWCSSSSPSSGEFFFSWLSYLLYIYCEFAAELQAAPHRALLLRGTDPRGYFAQLGHNQNSLSYSRWQQPQAGTLNPRQLWRSSAERDDYREQAIKKEKMLVCSYGDLQVKLSPVD